ncbi:MAG: hypothetical protein ACYDB3_11095, partial [Acidimicrobiales bacterium]
DNPSTNTGFGGPSGSGLYQPVGAYREYRPVSYPDPDIAETQVSVGEFTELIVALQAAGANVTVTVSATGGK